ncbi:uncharacterized protein B0P05DRAFT_563029 [Gilbertella persicaria]|uniref:Uncharacterized protein n=1 Tax=Rhizopus stolonifer TaxID=4846 RepID=A0A367KL56_RHIST|nr:uncharacterized protein B0P05DRAFT_563029 [Gilbertella persicaria]KAI8050649.1 hypothetical protein B0P05DRAFT_563029 [Gilbertella persicaria]RCI02572.1 hypothetical protein CU098_007875 [Rhizopus stolonifer]
MKFISSALLAISAVSAAVLTPRQDASQDQSQVLSQYPQGTDIGVVNGTWFVTGATQDVWNAFQFLNHTMNIDVGCVQVNATTTSNTTFDGLVSAFLTHTNSNIGINASVAGSFMLKAPDSNTNTSDHTYLWDAYGSQIFVNKVSWENFTSNGQSNSNASDAGSAVIPGSQPFEATVYSKLIDSNAQPGSNDSTNFDTVFLWSNDMKFLSTNNQKRADKVYGIILSKTSSIGQDTFNKTVALLPNAIAANNISIVQIEDTCHTGDNNNNQQQQQ